MDTHSNSSRQAVDYMYFLQRGSINDHSQSEDYFRRADFIIKGSGKTYPRLKVRNRDVVLLSHRIAIIATRGLIILSTRCRDTILNRRWNGSISNEGRSKSCRCKKERWKPYCYWRWHDKDDDWRIENKQWGLLQWEWLIDTRMKDVYGAYKRAYKQKQWSGVKKVKKGWLLYKWVRLLFITTGDSGSYIEWDWQITNTFLGNSHIDVSITWSISKRPLGSRGCPLFTKCHLLCRSICRPHWGYFRISRSSSPVPRYTKSDREWRINKTNVLVNESTKCH